MVDVIVVGGGIVGTSIAFHLVHHGASVKLICRHDQARATDAGAGIMTPQTTRATDRWFRFAMQAFDHYMDLAHLLSDESPADLGFERSGALLVAETDDDPHIWQTVRDDILARQTAKLSTRPVSEISSDEARHFFPSLGPIQGALYNPDAYRIDGRQITTRLRNAAIALGLSVVHGSVKRLIMDRRAVTGVEVDGQAIQAKWVVISGGAWSDRFSDQLGRNVPVRPERGQIIHLKLDGPPLPTISGGDLTAQHAPGKVTWPIVNSLKGHYIVPWPDGHVAIGSTNDQVGYDARPTAQGAHWVLSRALHLAPGLGTAIFQTIKAGLRPVSPDGLPVLGHVPDVDGVLLATGHGSTGLQLGPYTGKLIADLIYHGDHRVDFQDLTIERWIKPA